MKKDAYRTFLIVNPRSGGGFAGRRFERIAEHVEAAVGDFGHALTSGPGDATRIAREAIEKGFEMIVAVGGDGTFNEVVNGFFEKGEPLNPEAVFGVIPRGTGGDLRRTLGVPKDLRQASALLSGRRVKTVDVGHVSFVSHDGKEAERVFINIASFGVSGLVVDRVNGASKILGGKASFMIGSVKALLQYRDQEVTVTMDDGRRVTGPVTCVAVCNGQYFGGGMRVAPSARMDDGLFDVTTWVGFSLKDFAVSSRMLYDGSHIEDPRTRAGHAKVLRADSEEKVLLDIDGEQPGHLPVTIRLLPSTLKLKC